MQIVIYPLFALTTFVSVVFLKLSVGLPVRTLMLASVFVMVTIFYKRHVAHFFNRHGMLLCLFAFMAVLGSSLAFVQHETANSIFQQLLRQTMQPLMVLICAYVMCYVVGARATAAVCLGVTAIVGVVAIAQALGVEFAWRIREIIGSIQGDPPITAAFVKNRARAMGLAFSPIEYSYLVASAYILLLILHRGGLVTNRTYWMIFALIMMIAVAIETRSLLLGIVVSEFFRMLSRGSITTYLILAFAAIVGYAVFTLMPEVDSRIVSVEDQSAAGRKVLYLFGLRLFLDNIAGFGWGFSAQEFAWLYWEHLTDFGKPEIVFRLALHNAFLNYILIYGVLGLVPLAYFTVAYPRAALQFFLIFICYFLHSFFHNKGLFVAGYHVWFTVAVYLYLQDQGFLRPIRPATVASRQYTESLALRPAAQPATVAAQA